MAGNLEFYENVTLWKSIYFISLEHEGRGESIGSEI